MTAAERLYIASAYERGMAAAGRLPLAERDLDCDTCGHTGGHDPDCTELPAEPDVCTTTAEERSAMVAEARAELCGGRL